MRLISTHYLGALGGKATDFYWIAASSLNAGSQSIVPAVGLFNGPEWSYLMMEPAWERTDYRPGVKPKVTLRSAAPGTYYPSDPARECDRLWRKYRIKPGQRRHQR